MRKVLILSALAACVSASAAVTQVSNRAALGATDLIDWGQFGPSFTNLGSSALGTSTGGMNFVVSSPAMERRDQGNGWAGYFPAGDRLLWNRDTGDITIQFAATQGAVGFDVQSDYYLNYTGTMKAYDGLGALLGTASVNGVNGSLTFLGLVSTNMDIAKVVISNLDSGGHNAFAINEVSLGQCQAVPEPTTMAALGLGALGFLKRRKKA